MQELMSVLGDCHIGVARRNKWLYEKVHRAFFTMCQEIRSPNVVFAGDLWDVDAPKPYDLVFVQNVVTGLFNDGKSINVIPGNHDRVTIDGKCAASVLMNCDLNMEPTSFTIGGLCFHLVPYTSDVIGSLREHTENNFNFEIDKKHILISHFSLNEANMFAGSISESDPVFNKYDSVILGDTHMAYDHGKFHTTGSTYFCNVDEMYSPRAIPSYVVVMEDGSVVRRTHKDWKPTIIVDESEAVDPDKLYLIVSSDAIPITKQNVFLKYKGKKEDADTLLKIDESVSIQGGVDKNKFFATVFPDMKKSDIKKLIDFEAGIIEVEDLVSKTTRRKKEVIDTSINDEAILQGAKEDGFFL